MYFKSTESMPEHLASLFHFRMETHPDEETCHVVPQRADFSCCCCRLAVVDSGTCWIEIDHMSGFITTRYVHHTLSV